MNQYEFFREAALRICGDLEIEKALQSCLLFMKNHLPVDIKPVFQIEKMLN